VVVSAADARRKYVKIYYLPYEVENKDLFAELGEYGHVYHIRRDGMAGHPGIESGVRTVTMSLNHPIPSFLKVVGCHVKVYYRGQLQTCRKCGSCGHFVKDCPEVECYRCRMPGHISIYAVLGKLNILE